MFWNYSENANHCTDEFIDLVDDRLLVFSRGSVRHSLYDLEEDQVLVNMENPWFEYPGQGRPTVEEFHNWKLIALDQKIGAILNDTASSDGP